MSINSNYYSNPYNCTYDMPSSSTQTVNNVNVYPGPQNKPYSMNIGPKNPNTSVSGRPPYSTPKGGSGLKTVAKKVLRPLKVIKPAHLIMLSVLGLSMCARTGALSSSSSSRPAADNGKTVEMAYKMGEQHIRDSIKTANLEKELKLAQDSIKMLKKLPK